MLATNDLGFIICLGNLWIEFDTIIPSCAASVLTCTHNNTNNVSLHESAHTTSVDNNTSTLVKLRIPLYV